MRAKRIGPRCQANKFYPHFLERHGEREWMRRSLERLRAARGVPLSTRGQDTVMRANTTQLWKESTANVPPLFWSQWPCRLAPETPPPTVFQMGQED